MRKVISVILILLVIVAICLSCVGCKSEIKGGATYYSYTFDMAKQTFVKGGASVSFSKDIKSYAYTFSDGSLTIQGAVEHMDKPKCYITTCSDAVAPVVMAKYREYLVSTNVSSDTLAKFDLMTTSFTPKQQFFVYKNYMFSSDCVELSHAIIDGESPSKFEGTFEMTSTNEQLKFKNGNIFSKNDDGKFDVKAGYYSVANDMLTLTMTNENGTDKYENGMLYRKRYLMATISLPNDINVQGRGFEELMNDSEWYEILASDFASYAGKTIAVLTDEFYSEKIK